MSEHPHKTKSNGTYVVLLGVVEELANIVAGQNASLRAR